MRVSFLEGIAGVHEVGGCVVLALQLQVELRRLAKGIPCGWKRREEAQERGLNRFREMGWKSRVRAAYPGSKSS